MAAFPHKGRVKVEVGFELLTTVANFLFTKSSSKLKWRLANSNLVFFFQAGDTVVLSGQFMRVRLHKYCNPHAANQQHLALDAISTQITPDGRLGKYTLPITVLSCKSDCSLHPSRGPLSLAIHPRVGMIVQFRSSMTASGNFSL